MLRAEPHLARESAVGGLVVSDKPDVLGMLARPSKPAGLDKLFQQIRPTHLALARLAPFGPAAVEHAQASDPKANFALHDDLVWPMNSAANRNRLANWNTAQQLVQSQAVEGWGNSELEIPGQAAMK